MDCERINKTKDTLGHLFQIYQKPMPLIGNCLRIEGRHSEKADKNLVEQIEKLPIEENHLFVTAEEMLQKHLKDQYDNSSSTML